MVDASGRICEINTSLCHLLGYERHELLGQQCSFLGCDACSTVRLDNSKGWCTLFEQKLIMRRRCHLRHKDGTKLPVIKNARLISASLEAHSEEKSVFSVECITDIREIVQRDAYIAQITHVLGSGTLPGMVGQAPCMIALFRAMQQAAQSDAPVFIQGESGSGKELVAHALHQIGPRAQGPFISLNCASLNSGVLESELFGHVRGAFTGAVRDRLGRFEAADGGTLFLDEIGDMPLDVQVKLLRVLESGQIERVGDHSPRMVNVRIVSATHRNLDNTIAEGRFREDLAYRIRVIPLHVPPLRQHREDIPLLIGHFLESLYVSGKTKKVFSAEAIRCLMAHDWPGNVRELRNAITYAVAMSPGKVIDSEHLPQELQMLDSNAPAVPTPDSHTPARHARPSLTAAQKAQQHEILTALAESNNNICQAARILGIHRTTLVNRMLRLGLRISKKCQPF